jgi:hypothetical protein
MKKFLFSIATLAIAFSSCKKSDISVPDPTVLQSAAFASGLKTPIGMAIDDKGQIWVTENGNGKNDAKISVVTPAGIVYPAITGFNSIISPEDGSPVGLTHLLFNNGKLYILHAVDGKLYTADVSAFSPGATPILANTLASEDIATFVKSQKLTNPLNSDAYNLCFGPGGDLYIVDAGANAIFKRSTSTKALSLFAKIPNIKDSTESVPTGIVYDGSKLLVSGLGGFPFTGGSTKIYQVDLAGNVSTYKTGYTALTDIVLTANNKPLALQFASFVFNPPANVGFQPNTGKILDENGTVLLNNLMMPTSILRNGDRTFYVLSIALGTIQKLSY